MEAEKAIRWQQPKSRRELVMPGLLKRQWYGNGEEGTDGEVFLVSNRWCGLTQHTVAWSLESLDEICGQTRARPLNKSQGQNPREERTWPKEQLPELSVSGLDRSPLPPQMEGEHFILQLHKPELAHGHLVRSELHSFFAVFFFFFFFFFFFLKVFF